MAESNLQKTGLDVNIHSLDFVERFNENLSKLMEALQVTRKIPVQAGFKLKTYKTVVTKAGESNIAEGEVIPLSSVKRTAGPEITIGLKKYRKSVTVEAIQEVGYENALNYTDEKLLFEVQKEMRGEFFNVLATGTTTVTAKNMQGALAQCWGKIQLLFEDDAVTPVVFANPLDMADYLAGANVTTQTVFGMTYIKDFMGVNIILNGSVPQGTVYATAPENIVLAYIPIASSEMGKAFPFVMDSTGYIGVMHDNEHTTLVQDTVIITGVKMFVENLAGIVKVTINAE